MIYKIALYKDVKDKNEFYKLNKIFNILCINHHIMHQIDYIDPLFELSITIDLAIPSYQVKKHIKYLFENLTNIIFDEISIDWDLMQ